MKWKILGKNDEVTTCEHCGKTGLKFTVIMTDGEEEIRYGRDCASKKLGHKALFIQRKAEQLDYERERGIRSKEVWYYESSLPVYTAPKLS